MLDEINWYESTEVWDRLLNKMNFILMRDRITAAFETGRLLFRRVVITLAEAFLYLFALLKRTVTHVIVPNVTVCLS